MTVCHLHGQAYTPGCPSCEAWDTEDVGEVKETRRRLSQWRLHNLCKRFLGHWWREVEPHVKTCRICKTTVFDGHAPKEAFYRFFNVPYTTTSLAPQGEAPKEGG